ncbi:DUF2624 family protein [Aquibacillus halophilus]|uniref:DUF2624 family protein n=1 Tax=Aquibacillus halophilus TaxID=930132 RepID=A0A6A8DC43_9BACI|nr:DUF2624 family protein [Aquibacillus halophilus]MRH43104.1 DUF2624 family protein [Aquibacillus halophilus]
MSNFANQLLLKKLRNVSAKELITHGNEYGISLTNKQAEDIASYLSKTSLNPINEKDRMKMFKKLAQITDIKTAQKAQKLFGKLIKQYGVESWFK